MDLFRICNYITFLQGKLSEMPSKPKEDAMVHYFARFAHCLVPVLSDAAFIIPCQSRSGTLTNE
jgi:hypothetical protein